jgi:hypothetical protein
MIRQLKIKGVISFRPLRLIVPETDAENLAARSTLFQENNGILIR